MRAVKASGDAVEGVVLIAVWSVQIVLWALLALVGALVLVRNAYRAVCEQIASDDPYFFRHRDDAEDTGRIDGWGRY